MKKKLGIAVIVLANVAILALGVFHFRAEARRENEFEALVTLRYVAIMQRVLHTLRESPVDIGSFGTLADLRAAKLVDADMASETRTGYSFQVQPGADPFAVWWGVARPIQPGVTGDRIFYVNQTRAIVSRPWVEGEEVALPDHATGAPPPGCRMDAAPDEEPEYANFK